MKSLLEKNRDLRRIALGTPAGLLAFGFGSGLSPWAPGTAGTVAAVPLAILLGFLPLTAYISMIFILFLLGIYSCGVTAKRLGKNDPGGIVWDEMVGFCLAVTFLPSHWTWWLGAFILFRLFDIWKPWPICQVEKFFKGGLGIMIDDILAALYTMAILALLR